MAENQAKIVITAQDETQSALRSVSSSLQRINAQAQSFAGELNRGFSPALTNNIRNASYQISDFIVQVQGGQRVSLALAQQLPQLLAGFGTFGAVAGVVAGVMPSIATAMGIGADEAKKLDTTVSELNGAMAEVGKTAKEFSMDKLYEEFNKANGVTRQGIIEQIKFQQAMIETQQLMANKALSKTLDGLGNYSFMDKLKGAFADSGSEKLAGDLGVSVDLAKDLLPAIVGLRNGTEDASNFMARFGIELAKSSSSGAQQLVKDIKSVAEGGRDAAAAQTRLSEALQKMGAAGVSGKIAIEGKEAKTRIAEASDEAKAYQRVMESLSKATLDAEASQLGLTGVAKQWNDFISSAEFRNMPQPWKDTALAQYEVAKSSEAAADEAKRLRDLLNVGPDAKLEKMRDDMQLLAKAFEDGKITAAQFNDAATGNLRLGSEEIKKQKTLAEELGLTFSSAFEDAMVSGKSFRDVLAGIGQDILRIITRKNITEPLANALGSFDFSSLFKFNADGGVYDSPSLSRFSNGVYDSPQVFAFAKGAGIFAEAGPEAIMPLKRDAQGRLGVSAEGAGGTGVVVNVINNASGTQATQSQRTDPGGVTIIDVLVEKVKGAVASDIGSGGVVAGALEGQYGLNRAAGAWR